MKLAEKLLSEVPKTKPSREMFEPAGGDQRNMRGSTRPSDKDDSDVWNGKFIEVDFPGWDKQAVKDRAKSHNVKLSPSKNPDKTVRIEGAKKDVTAFLMASGWNKADLKKWYGL